MQTPKVLGRCLDARVLKAEASVAACWRHGNPGEYLHGPATKVAELAQFSGPCSRHVMLRCEAAAGGCCCHRKAARLKEEGAELSLCS